MPTARKLPSGAYRCQVFAGYEIKDGKKVRKYESFTAYDKNEAEVMAANWRKNKNKRPDDITIRKAVDLYIKSRENVLSPVTIRGYNTCANRLGSISDKRIRSVRQADVQLWISEIACDYSAKTVANTYGLLMSALKFVAPDVHICCKLPAKEKKDYYIPPEKDLQKVFRHVEGSRLWIAMMLARYYSLRRSEICALRSEDLQGNILTIRRAVVPDKDGNWIIKDRPKTYSSYRSLTIADPLLSAMKKIDGNIMDCNPNALFDRFRRAVKASEVKPFTFHALRHMFATGAALKGIPDIFTAKLGGWQPDSRVLKQVYQNVRDEDLQKQMAILNKSMQHDMQHEKPKKRKKVAK